MLVTQRWPSEVAIFNGLTGETHVVSQLPATVVEILSDHALGLFELAARVAETAVIANDSDLRSKLMEVLEGLEEMELVERVSATQRS